MTVTDLTPLDAALAYATYGWRVVPIKPGDKRPPMTEWQDKATTDEALIRQWWEHWPDHGVGIATGSVSDLFVLDVDVSDGKQGDETLADLEATYGALPPTVEVLTGSGGRHLYFRMPDGEPVHNDAGKRLGPGLDIRGEGGQVLAPPTVHPNGRRYEWETEGDPELVDVAVPPDWLVILLTAVPEPPTPRVSRLTSSEDRPGDRWAAQTDWADLLTADGATHLSTRTDHRSRESYEMWARPGVDHASGTLYYRGSDVLKVFSSEWVVNGVLLEQDATYTKFGYWAATRHGGDHAAAARALAGDVDLSWAANGDAQGGLKSDRDSDEIVVREQDWRDRLVDGRTWLTTGLEAPEAIWGNERALLWPTKQPLVIAGPQGAGKTVFGERLCLGFIGVGAPELLGLPLVERVGAKALYLASDRPDQARLSMRRMVDEEDFEQLGERLVVWPGPPPADIAKNPDLLLTMANEAGAELVVIDSLKDIALKLSDDDVGSAVNRAIQLCIAAEIDVIALHHPRKLGGTDKNDRPRSLDDIYGSYWLTAGAGSVLYLHPGEADTFSLLQFKTPVGEKAELMFKHDHARGSVEVMEPIDALTIVENAGYEGITVEHIAMHLYVTDSPDAKQRKAVNRKLLELAQEDLVEKVPGAAVGVAKLWRSTSV